MRHALVGVTAATLTVLTSSATILAYASPLAQNIQVTAQIGAANAEKNPASAPLNANFDCRHAGPGPVYDCAIRLTEGRSGKPVPGASVTLGADMPSMPMAHNVRAVKAVPAEKSGTYSARLTLEMYGSWTLKLRIVGAKPELITKTMEFAKTR